MHQLKSSKLDVLIKRNQIELGRGNIISRNDIENQPGPYPIYSSSAHNDGKFGEYANYMFNEELITWSVDGGGYFFYRPKHKFSVTNVCGYIRVKDQNIFAPFLFYVLSQQHSYLTFDYTSKAHPSVIRNLYEVPIVSLCLQKKIAYILQTIDQAIEKTEQLIEKYQQIKAGLMYDLFTRGIGANGKLRPLREQAPELYQETPIGWIPKEWTLKRCEDICTRICVGIVIQPTQYYVNDGVPAFRSANIREHGIEPTNFVYISPESNDALLKSQVKTGDVLTVRTGYPGTSAVVPKEFKGSNCIDILISTPSTEVDPHYLCNWVNSSFGKGQVLKQQGGMAQQHFNVGEMKELLVALPAMPEQFAISGRISVSSRKIAIEEDMLKKLQKQKSGLMHDLLTGKVPVSVDTVKAPLSPEQGAA